MLFLPIWFDKIATELTRERASPLPFTVRFSRIRVSKALTSFAVSGSYFLAGDALRPQSTPKASSRSNSMQSHGPDRLSTGLPHRHDRRATKRILSGI